MATAQPLTIEQKIVEMVTQTNEVVKTAAAVVTAADKTAKAVETAIPACIKALVDNERIDAADATKFAAALRDPVKALDLLCKVAGHRNAGEARLGTPVEGDGSQKTANETPGRRGETLRDSDRRLFAGLGLAVPRS